MLAAGFPCVTKVAMDLAIAVDSTTFQPGLLDQSDQSLVLLLSWRYGLFQPRIEATSVNPQGLAQGNDTVPVESGGYERVPFLDSLAKYAAVNSTCQRNTLFNNFFWRFKFQGLPRPAV